MITFIFEVNSPEIPIIAQKITPILEKSTYKVQMDVGHNFINIYYPDIDKASGLQLYLKQEKGLDITEIAGIGDSMSDWNFVQHCGFRACPANADPRLKEKCDYIASKSDVAGVIEIIQKIHENNQSIQSNHL
jgi:hydroxymethylpyrimidine pyrophosphatase-like HAD family hydrolase